jgi:hypothetical protein
MKSFTSKSTRAAPWTAVPDHHRPGDRASLALPSNLPFSEWVKSVRSGPAAELNHRRDCISGGLSTDKLMDTR